MARRQAPALPPPQRVRARARWAGRHPGSRATTSPQVAATALPSRQNPHPTIPPQTRKKRPLPPPSQRPGLRRVSAGRQAAFLGLLSGAADRRRLGDVQDWPEQQLPTQPGPMPQAARKARLRRPTARVDARASQTELRQKRTQQMPPPALLSKPRCCLARSAPASPPSHRSARRRSSR